MKRSPPRMTPHINRRPREYLFEYEVERTVMEVQARNKWHHRNAALIWISYVHALRSVEARNLRKTQLDFHRKKIKVLRAKGGIDTTQTLSNYEISLLQGALSMSPPDSPYVFTNEQGEQLERSTVYKLVRRSGELADIPFPIHPHMLRHACGYHLVNEMEIDIRIVKDYLGHRNIQHTMLYTALNEHKFERLSPGFGKNILTQPVSLGSI